MFGRSLNDTLSEAMSSTRQADFQYWASLAWNMPLGEAAELLEQYFEKHDYLPPNSGRGGIPLAPLKAAYAVGTTYGWGDSDIDGRRARIIAILGKCAEAFAKAPGYKEDLWPEYKQDLDLIGETIEAIRSNRSGYPTR